jgi:hypothetical protein
MAVLLLVQEVLDQVVAVAVLARQEQPEQLVQLAILAKVEMVEPIQLQAHQLLMQVVAVVHQATTRLAQMVEPVAVE